MQDFEVGSVDHLTDAEILAHRDAAIAQMRWLRQYTLQLIDSVPQQQWYEQPAGTPTHVAWQVGHLAVSQYGLMLFRQRGRAAGDLEIMPGWLRKRFGRGSSPMPCDGDAPAPATLLEYLHRIHQQSLEESSQLSATTLREPVDLPYAAFPNKLGALLLCPIHESIHAGQIGLVRRLLGYPPLR
ncbi:MAG: DinB family protein [Planctomycetota bacterium]|nr:MAG: DinB family protein [Planctomycetota bacterium]